MLHKRIYIRVPITGEAVLSNDDGVQARTPTIDISPGGIGVSNPLHSLDQEDYQIEVITATGNKVHFAATLIRHNEQSIGFRISDIDKENLQVLADLLAEYQSSNDFIKQIDTHDLLEQSFIDADGNEVAVSFEIGSKKE